MKQWCCAIPVLLIPAPARALDPSDWTLDPAVLLDATSASYAPNGIGAPAVAWDGGREEWVMVFEFRTNLTHALCGSGVWGLGIARSPDGFVWMPETKALFIPIPGSGTPYECVAAHPAVMWAKDSLGDPDFNRLRVWFKAQQRSDPCPDGFPQTDWGCSEFTGISLLTVNFSENGRVRSRTMRSGVEVGIQGSFGFNDVLNRADGSYLLVVQIGDSIEAGTAFRGSDEGDYDLVVAPGTYTWNASEVFGPSLMCMSDGSIQSFLGGRTISGGNITEGGWGPATSVDGGFTWDWPDTPQFTFSGNEAWRHWSAARVDVDDYLVWYSELSGGSPRVRLAYTIDPGLVDPANIADNVCE